MNEDNKQPKEFWICNVSKRDVMISDLYLSVKSFTSVNLLDAKHHRYTWDQIIKSCTSGSIFKKRDKIYLRDSAPIKSRKVIQVDSDSILPNREKSIFEIKEEKFEELNLTDEQFAEENSDLR